MTSGAAPRRFNPTEITGKSTSGRRLTPIRVKEIPPKIMREAMSIQAKTGFLIEISERLIN